MSSASPNPGGTETTTDGNNSNANTTNMGEPEKGRLTESEKKQNHIASEQKRRQAIREGFDRLSEIVPGLTGHGRSEALVLKKTVDFMVEKLMERRRLVEECDEKGIDVDEYLRRDLQRLKLWEEYRKNKVAGADSEASSDDKKIGPGPKKRTTSR